MEKERQLITVDTGKCNNCLACITACPVKYCIDASGDHPHIIDSLCIGCGNCIPACRQRARSYNDDTADFFSGLQAGKEIIAIVAPASAAVFDDILRLNSYLKSKGVRAVFDVSFGAELTVRSYLKFAGKSKPRIIIAQPCPAIVTFCELYKPELLPFLAPAQSPMLHTAAMIKNFFPKYRDARIAAISPCIAKSREFAETGLIDYNVTMLRLKEKLDRENISIQSFEKTDYDGPRAERAVLFSSPGGLGETAVRDAPGLSKKIRRIEGPGIIYKYLEELPGMIKRGASPFIIDCLSCETGCNGGHGTGNFGEPVDLLESRITKRAREAVKANKRGLFAGRKGRTGKAVGKYWKNGIYGRKYRDLSAEAARIRKPDEAALKDIYHSMLKFGDADMYNCSSCGYGSCHDMAKAIFNKLNKSENCHHYVISKAKTGEREKAETLKAQTALITKIENSRRTLSEIYDKISAYTAHTDDVEKALKKASVKMENLISNIINVSRTADEKRKHIETLKPAADEAKKDMHLMLNSFGEVARTTEEIAGIADVIEDIATSTNLLAMNAAIEAAHAGESGKGFAVVAGEVRKLASKTQDNAKSISDNIKNIVKQIDKSVSLSNQADTVIGGLVDGVDSAADSFSDIALAHKDLNFMSGELTEDLRLMNEKSAGLNRNSALIVKELESVRELITALE